MSVSGLRGQSDHKSVLDHNSQLTTSWATPSGDTTLSRRVASELFTCRRTPALPEAQGGVEWRYADLRILNYNNTSYNNTPLPSTYLVRWNWTISYPPHLEGILYDDTIGILSLTQEGESYLRDTLLVLASSYLVTERSSVHSIRSCLPVVSESSERPASNLWYCSEGCSFRQSFVYNTMCCTYLGA